MPVHQPLLSVVLCTYNGERYLAKQLDSILSQTYRHLEVVVSDDLSTDGTLSILKQYAAMDSRIKLHVNSANLGYNKNFEQACSYASAEWMAIADQDDIWLPHKLTALYGCVQPDTLLVHSYNAEFKNNDPTVTFINPSRLRFKGSHTRELFFYNTVSGHTVLFHKKLFALAFPFPEGVYYDWWLGVNASVQSRVQLHTEALVLHRQHDANASHLQNRFGPKEQKARFFSERIHTLQCFLQITALAENDRHLLRRYVALLQTQQAKRFSLPVFFFFLRHATSAFYFRKKKPMFFYYLKYSLQRASMKVKHWT